MIFFEFLNLKFNFSVVVVINLMDSITTFFISATFMDKIVKNEKEQNLLVSNK